MQSATNIEKVKHCTGFDVVQASTFCDLRCTSFDSSGLRIYDGGGLGEAGHGGDNSIARKQPKPCKHPARFSPGEFRSCPGIVQSLPNGCRSLAPGAETPPEIGHSWPSLANFDPSLAHLRPSLAVSWLDSPHIGHVWPTLPKIGQCWSNAAKHWSKSDIIGPRLANIDKFGRSWRIVANIAKNCQYSSDVVRAWRCVCQTRPQVGQTRSQVGHTLTKVCPCRPELAEIAQNLGSHGYK